MELSTTIESSKLDIIKEFLDSSLKDTQLNRTAVAIIDSHLQACITVIRNNKCIEECFEKWLRDTRKTKRGNSEEKQDKGEKTKQGEDLFSSHSRV